MTKYSHPLAKAVEIARYAPSSHNSQPWRVRMLEHGEQRFSCEVAFDLERLLNGLPSLEREMYISCGVFTRFLVEALTCMGYELNVEWIGSPSCLCRLTAEQTGSLDSVAWDLLRMLIRSRRTQRGPYSSALIPMAEREALTVAAGVFPGELRVHTQRPEIGYVAEAVKQYAVLDLEDSRVWRETYDFIRFSEAQPAEDGFYLSHLFGRRPWWFRQAFRVGFHPRLRPLYCFFGLPKQLARQLGELVAQTPHVLTMTAENESPHTLFLVGESLAQVLLKAQEFNWDIHPVSVLVQHQTPQMALGKALGLAHPMVFIARLGRSGLPASAPIRREVASILKFG